jgi:hypothetical protein
MLSRRPCPSHPHRPVLHAAALLALAASAALPAVDVWQDEDHLDVRLAAGVNGGIDDQNTSYPGSWDGSSVDGYGYGWDGGDSRSLSDRGGASVDAQVLYVWNQEHAVGFAAGGGIFVHSHEGHIDATAPHLVADGFEGHFGLVFTLAPGWELEAPALVLGVGDAFVTGSQPSDSNTGDYGSAELQAGITYTFRFGLQLGATLGVESWTADVHERLPDGERVLVTYDGVGPAARLEVGYRF